MAKKKSDDNAIAVNRRARHEYEINETFEAGMVLHGTEVKSLREGKANVSDAFARVNPAGDVELVNLHIPPYSKAARGNHEPTRARKLLMHKKEIERLRGKTQEKGFTLVPMKMYWKNGYAKILLGLGRGKKLYDKRADIKKRDVERQLARVMREHKR